MQDAMRISLNALRVFATVAEQGSVKLAAGRIGVSPGAVSHQLRALEEALGLRLFERGNNSIRLTAEGEALWQRAAPALATLHGAVEAALSRQAALAVQLPVTLAIRWLIPQLDAFRARNPDLRITIETTGVTGMPIAGGADIVIAYYPAAQLPGKAEPLLEDRCRPWLAPALLERLGGAPRLEDVPALQCAHGNWDWQAWLHETGRTGVALRMAGQFDLDDTALRAAVAGMGMVLAPDFIVADDLAAGRLCALPGAGEVCLGGYVLHCNAPASRGQARFADWLRALAGRG